MSKDEVIAAIQECAEKLGRRPHLGELKSLKKLTLRQIARHYGTYARALAAAGLEAKGPGFEVSLEELFNDWAALVRKLGRLPSLMEYEENSRYSASPMRTRFGAWKNVPTGMLRFAEQKALDKDWHDVMNVIRGQNKDRYKTSFALSSSAFRPTLPGRPTYGAPLMLPAMANAPTCEQGVIFLFGVVAERLGFVITRLQAAFPDGEAMQRIDEERWQRVRIEFEFESRNFLMHGHSINQCDLIVCWTHTWSECPIEVLELKSVLNEWGKHRT